MSQTMVFFGDSISAGYRAQPGQGWVELLGQGMPEWRCVNSGVSGETTSDALRRFDTAVVAHKPDAVYVQFGLNDASWWCRQVGRSWLSEEEYLRNMVDIVARSARCGARHIVVATNHPVVQAAPETEGTPTYPGVVRQYNAALRRQFGVQGQVAEENANVVLVDLEAAIDQSAEPLQSLLDPDGVHLSTAGNRFYAKTVEALLRDCLRK